MKKKEFLRSLTAIAVVAISFMACSKVSVQPAQSEEDLVVKKSQKSMDFIVNEDIDLCQNYPPTGFYGENILSDEVTTVKRGQNYSMRVNLYIYGTDDCLAGNIIGLTVNIITADAAGFYYLYDKEAKDMNWGASSESEYHRRFSAPSHMRNSDMFVRVLTEEDYITIEYFETTPDTPIGNTPITKVKRLRVID